MLLGSWLLVVGTWYLVLGVLRVGVLAYCVLQVGMLHTVLPVVVLRFGAHSLSPVVSTRVGGPCCAVLCCDHLRFCFVLTNTSAARFRAGLISPFKSGFREKKR